MAGQLPQARWCSAPDSADRPPWSNCLLPTPGSGDWTLDANASALAPLTSGAVFGYEIWETASARVFLTGELRVNRSLSFPT
ncbi:hypothetical protein C357_22415 [Citreicella sp. 357]|nr:hypothetical protein C357_22415 [Citreicella sp. 357]